MSKRSAAKAVVSAPVVAPVPPPPPREIVAVLLKHLVEDQWQTVSKFQEAVAKDPSYAMVWRGADCMQAQAVLRDLREFQIAFEGRAEIPPVEQFADGGERGGSPAILPLSDAELLESVRGEMRRIEDDLLGSSRYYHSTRGPWSSHSTCPFTNIQTEKTLDAKRELYAFYRQVIRAFSRQESV